MVSASVDAVKCWKGLFRRYSLEPGLPCVLFQSIAAVGFEMPDLHAGIYGRGTVLNTLVKAPFYESKNYGEVSCASRMEKGHFTTVLGKHSWNIIRLKA